jgi:hypothetical protein
MTADQPLGQELAGYRVVRRLGAGSRADVFLGSGSTGTVALKVFHAGVESDDIGTELDALGRLDSPHLARLVDVCSGEDNAPILILERVSGGNLVSLLRDRDCLEAGEVVTVLAPIAAVLHDLHRSGVAHRRISATSVHLGSAGEPVLLGFGHCALFPAGGSIAAIESEPATAEDRDALATLAGTLLARVRNAATERGVLELLEWIDSAPREFEFSERLESRLFELADPMAIEFSHDVAAASSVPARIRFADRVPSIPVVAAPAVAAPAMTGVSPTEQPEGVTGRMARFLLDNPIDALRARAINAAKNVRKPFWFVAGGVVLAFIVVLAVLPSAPQRPAAAVTPPAATNTPQSSPAPPRLPTDPVLALPILLTARTACIQSMSVLCLDNVDEQSSSAYSSDAGLIEQLQGGSEIPQSAIIAAPAPALVELLGDSAIVSLGQGSDPASVIMIKDAAGWRIRGYLSGIQSTGSPVQQK